MNMTGFLSTIFVSLLCQSAAKFSDWNTWSACSMECGKGFSSREKIAILQECYTELSEQRDCEGPCRSRTNLALHKKVSSSSTFLQSFPSSNAVDGNNDTDFYGGKSCMMTKKDDNPWLKIDLGEGVIVNEVTVFNRGDCCSHRLNNFIVAVGSDAEGVEYKICGKKFNMKDVNFTRVACPEPLIGRYVHVKINGPQFLSICEVEVFGGILPYLTFGKNASQSSRNGDNFAMFAVDGDLNTFSHTEHQSNGWWRVDIGKLAMIDKVRLYSYDNSGSYERGGKVNIGKDATNMTLCGTIEEKDMKRLGGYYAYDITCTNSMKGRFLEVNTVHTIYLIIRELKVHGYFLE